MWGFTKDVDSQQIGSVSPPPGSGWAPLACGRGGGGVPIPTRGHTLWYFIMYIVYMHFVVLTVPYTAFVFDGFF
jgi:hypothetical protein